MFFNSVFSFIVERLQCVLKFNAVQCCFNHQFIRWFGFQFRCFCTTLSTTISDLNLIAYDLIWSKFWIIWNSRFLHKNFDIQRKICGKIIAFGWILNWTFLENHKIILHYPYWRQHSALPHVLIFVCILMEFFALEKLLNKFS